MWIKCTDGSLVNTHHLRQIKTSSWKPSVGKNAAEFMIVAFDGIEKRVLFSSTNEETRDLALIGIVRALATSRLVLDLTDPSRMITEIK